MVAIVGFIGVVALIDVANGVKQVFMSEAIGDGAKAQVAAMTAAEAMADGADPNPTLLPPLLFPSNMDVLICEGASTKVVPGDETEVAECGEGAVEDEDKSVMSDIRCS